MKSTSSNIKIYHNTSCSKSCAAVQLLENKDTELDIVNYMDGNLRREELKNILQLLRLSPLELMRTKEPLFQQQFKDLVQTDEQWIDTMIKHPILIERPIIIKGDKAIIGRPVERLIDLLDKTP